MKDAVSERRLTISGLCELAQVKRSTVRFYEREGLIPQPMRSSAGYRLYLESDVERLRLIRMAKDSGLSLAEIRAWQVSDELGFDEAGLRQLLLLQMQSVMPGSEFAEFDTFNDSSTRNEGTAPAVTPRPSQNRVIALRMEGSHCIDAGRTAMRMPASAFLELQRSTREWAKKASACRIEGRENGWKMHAARCTGCNPLRIERHWRVSLRREVTCRETVERRCVFTGLLHSH